MTDDVEYFDLALLVDNNISLRRFNEIRDALEDIEVFIIDEETEYDDNYTYLTAQYPDTIPFSELVEFIEGMCGHVAIDYETMEEWASEGDSE